MTSLYDLVGFDYVRAVSDLLLKFTYADIASRVGYRSTGSITSILDGQVPSHMHGEAIWALYIETFKRKPPLIAQKNANTLLPVDAVRISTSSGP